MKLSILGVLGCLLFLGCKDKITATDSANTNTLVKVNFENSYNQKVYIETIPISGEKPQRIDSALIKDRIETHNFQIKDSFQNLYLLRFANSPVKIVFINDVSDLTINVDFFNWENFKILGSPASQSLLDFANRMNTESDRQKFSGNQVPGLVNSKATSNQQAQYRSYLDTVSSPAAALYFFTGIDFGNDYSGMKSFVNRLYNRFNTHPGIAKLKKVMDDYASIFEEEFQINDMGPDLELPDSSARMLKVSSFRGKYVLLDFWAAWNYNCRKLSSEKVQVFNQFKHKNFTIISISLDPDLEYWKKSIALDHYTWPQMNDPEVWYGKAVNTYKFDSIPFNFLLNPEGRIIAKAIYGDKLIQKLKRILP